MGTGGTTRGQRILERCAAARARHGALERQLADPAVLADRARTQALAKELAQLAPLVRLAAEYERVGAELATVEDVGRAGEADAELSALARDEARSLRARQEALLGELERGLEGRDATGERSAIMEIRAGTGGAEAGLFAADLYRMYTRYAAGRGWRVEVMSSHPTARGGVREMIFAIEGPGAFGQLRYERGVHRVQRVPATEAAGRIHTSAVTVAVLPEADEVEVRLEPKDLQVDVFRSSGPGGQGVNTTDSAVRLTHRPTGLVVTCQDERSQLKNKAKALRVLRARLLDRLAAAQEAQRSRDRKAQVGSGDRSEKIRTYNFPQHRVTDHRIGLTLHTLDDILSGRLDPLIGPLQEADRARAE